ncbi:hypothetical protein PDO_1846 [Rhizobium sp. PDO1-076]|uniref:hypothetical protein n=1 Tax=Rhizobium sp. PDO1-076 TaxID=1125979 RepID=UPI00024E3268|nr:hypothetical protein [Rhizobium sp. PDO1-076]EHS51588.1 hypothetical protein PDO_1846 [Rhizobium sp. PDO1-076]
MMFTAERRLKFLPLAAIGLASVLIACLIFIGWMRYGSAIFLSLVETGLSYCF